MATALSKERLDRIRGLARTLVNDYRLMGRWGWYGNTGLPSAYLATKGNGRRYVMGVQNAHLHWTWNPADEPEDVEPMVANDCPGRAGSTDCSHSGADLYGSGRLAADHAMPAFPVKIEQDWTVLKRGDEIPVFEVCRDATSKDDPRVYRTDVVGFRSPAAEWLAEMDPETVLALLDELGKARWLLGSLLDDLRAAPDITLASTLLAARAWLERNGGLPADADPEDSAALVDVVADLGEYVEPAAEVAR